MKMTHKMTRYARKVKGKLTAILDPEHLATLARQSQFIQRSSSKLVGPEFVELMTTELMDEPAVSLEGLRHLKNYRCPLRLELDFGHSRGITNRVG